MQCNVESNGDLHLNLTLNLSLKIIIVCPIYFKVSGTQRLVNPEVVVLQKNSCLTRNPIPYNISSMWHDFTKNLIPQEVTLSKEDMDMYKKYLKDINFIIYTGDIAEGKRKGKFKGKKRFNRTSCKNKT